MPLGILQISDSELVKEIPQSICLDLSKAFFTMTLCILLLHRWYTQHRRTTHTMSCVKTMHVRYTVQKVRPAKNPFSPKEGKRLCEWNVFTDILLLKIFNYERDANNTGTCSCSFTRIAPLQTNLFIEADLSQAVVFNTARFPES